jgi:hypothetical protein
MTNDNPRPLSDEQIIASWRSEMCAACGKYKRAGSAFCATDTAALTLPMRWNLEDGTNFGAFRAALRHLQLHTDRRAQFAEGEWKYRSAEELERAGYKFSSHRRCAVKVPDHKPFECGARITIYITPNGKRIALDAITLQPHRSKCVDPDYFERKREAKQQAKRSRRVQPGSRGRRSA